MRFLELVAPVTAEAVAEPAEHSHEVDGLPGANTALVVVMRDVQAQMQPVTDW